mgnify:CR=1 FL=1
MDRYQFHYTNAIKAGDTDVLRQYWRFTAPTVPDISRLVEGGHYAALLAAPIVVPKNEKALCTIAAHHGYLNILRWAHAEGYAWDKGTCDSAACCGHLEVLQWLVARGCPIGANTCASAAYAISTPVSPASISFAPSLMRAGAKRKPMP